VIGEAVLDVDSTRIGVVTIADPFFKGRKIGPNAGMAR